MPKQDPAIDPELKNALVDRFTDVVMRAAGLPEGRRSDIRDSAIFSQGPESELRCVCTITGAEYAEKWDGTPRQAAAFAEEVGTETAWLLANTRHYAWLRARR